MKNKVFVLICICFVSNQLLGQNKKELNAIILKLKADSTQLVNQINNQEASLTKMTQANFELKKDNETKQSAIFRLNREINDARESLRSGAEKVATLNSQIAELKDSLIFLKDQLDIKTSTSYEPVSAFVELFYNSLELTPEENQRQYNEGGVRFDLEMFKALLTSYANYSRKRVENLSDPNYHDRFYIGLEGIDKIIRDGDTFQVYTNVVYGVYEMGNFYNKEVLTLNNKRGWIRLVEWRDLGLSKMDLGDDDRKEAFGLENFTERDFYKMMGSINK